MLFVVHNVSYERSVLKVGGKKCFVIDMLMVSLPFFLYLCLNWNELIQKEK